MFFGFTQCGMVCPTTMTALNKMYGILADRLPPEKMPQIVMVTVDPERDSIAKMNAFVTSFNPHFIGARAEKSQLQDLEEEFHLVAVKMLLDNTHKDQYTVNHSAEIVVLNPNGEVQAFLSSPHVPEAMANDYESLLKFSTIT